MSKVTVNPVVLYTLVKEFGRNDFVFHSEINQHISVGLYVNKKDQSVWTVTPKGVADPNALITESVKVENLRPEMYVVFRVSAFLYQHGRIEHDVLKNEGWVEVRTNLYIGVRGPVGKREYVTLTFSNGTFSKSTAFEKYEPFAHRDIEALLVRVSNHSAPANSRVGVFNGKYTDYGRFLLANGRKDKSIRDYEAEAGIQPAKQSVEDALTEKAETELVAAAVEKVNGKK